MLDILFTKSFEGMLLASADSLSQSMDRAVKHYQSLFTLPPYPKLLLLLALTCISGGLISTLILFSFPEGLVNGLLLGFSLFFLNFFVDYAVSMLILRRDPIYGLKRTTALSLFCWGLWFFFIFVGVAFGLQWGIRLCLLGFSAATISRLIVLFSTSSKGRERLLAASLLQPFSCVIPFLVIWAGNKYSVIPITFFLIFSLFVSLISSLAFLSIINRVGTQTLGVPSLPLFKAFLLNWIADLNAPFEEFLEKLGEDHDVEVSMIQFSSFKPKAAIVVPSIHPGPFKNIGSSFLPSMLKTVLEKEYNSVVCVPHGLLGHEFDLASQVQNQKIINQVVEFANFEVSEGKATRFIKVSNGLATACCQVFGNLAFLSFSLAPKTTEDLPQELGLFVREEAKRLGLTCCVVVNAHNSIDGTTNMQEALESLKTVATTCLKKAISLRQLPFEVGVATVIPKDFSLREGMGPSGITVLVVKVEKQKTAYIVIDGNNMVSGLRENILSTLRSVGIDEGEVFTTDTHSVNALVLNERGYHPVGAAMDHEKLIGYIKEATLSSLSNLEPVKAACRSITIPGVKVIGEKRLETLCLLIDRALNKAKKAAIPIFATSGLLLMLVLMFI
jgi:putative membrane protein